MPAWLDKLLGRTPPAPCTGRIYACAAVVDQVGFPVHTADDAYAEVSSAWLKAYYSDYRRTLFREGVVRWDEAFDCDNFASLYVGLANLRFFTASFHSRTEAQSLALGEYWYRPAGGLQGHAIVTALTERGQIFLEPQSGQELHLSPDEQLSRFLVKF